MSDLPALDEKLVEAAAIALREEADRFSSPVAAYVEGEAGARHDAVHGDMHHFSVNADWELESWKILARAALTAASAIRAPQGVEAVQAARTALMNGIRLNENGVAVTIPDEAMRAALTAASAIRAPQGVVTKEMVAAANGGEADKAPALCTFLGALEEWGCEDHHQQAKAILAFLDGGCDLSEYEDRSHPSPSSGEAEPAKTWTEELERIAGSSFVSGARAAMLREIAEHLRFRNPSPSGVNAPADEDAALANFDSFKGSFFATHRAAMGVNADVVAALEEALEMLRAASRILSKEHRVVLGGKVWGSKGVLALETAIRALQPQASPTPTEPTEGR